MVNLKRPRAEVPDEGENMDWVRTKILKEVDANSKQELQAKFTAAETIKKLIKDNLAERTRLNNSLDAKKKEIEEEKAGMEDLDIKEALCENALHEIGIKMDKLEVAREVRLAKLGLIQGKLLTSKKKIAEDTKQIVEWNQEVLESKTRLVALEGDLEALPAAVDFNPHVLQLLGKQLDTLQQDLQCPICLNVCTLPIYTCPEQHPVCSTCRPKLEICGVCRETYGMGMASRGILINQIIFGQISKFCIISLI